MTDREQFYISDAEHLLDFSPLPVKDLMAQVSWMLEGIRDQLAIAEMSMSGTPNAHSYALARDTFEEARDLMEATLDSPELTFSF